MKAAISKLNQSGLHLDDEAVRTIQAASRPDWNPSEQLVLVTIPDLSQQTASRSAGVGAGVAQGSGLQVAKPHWAAGENGSVSPKIAGRAAAMEVIPVATPAVRNAPVETAEAGISKEPTAPPAQAQRESLAIEPAASPAPKPVSPSAADKLGGHAAVVEAIVTRFGSTASFLLHFCDIDQPQRSAEVCLSVGFELAERMQRRILLLDSSRTNRPLSSLLGVDLAAGFREVVRTDLNWRNLVRPTSHPLVEVLPAGVIKLGAGRGPEQELAVRKLVAELSQRYGGICSCADSAYDFETELLGRCSSGAFLTIDFQMTSRGLARAAARQMQLSGNRLLGCIAAALPT